MTLTVELIHQAIY